MAPRLLLVLGILAAALGAGCGGSTATVATTTSERPASTKTAAGAGSLKEPAAVPDEIHIRLDVAERDLARRGVPYRVIGGGATGLGPPSDLTVCETNPAPRTHLESGTTVRLIVRRSCQPGTR